MDDYLDDDTDAEQAYEDAECDELLAELIDYCEEQLIIHYTEDQKN